MAEQVLKISRPDDRYVLLTLNRLGALNALNRALMEALNTFFTEGYRDLGAFSAVVITGAGEKAFAAGADISEFGNLSPEEGLEFSAFGQSVFFAIENFDFPVIAAVNGYALGGGCELAMACHLRIASENARFGQPEVNLGLIPGYGGTQRLIQYLGKGRAMEYMLTADMIRADKALDLGLVNRVVPQAELMACCEEVIGKLAGKGPLALRNIIRSVNAFFSANEHGFRTEAGLFGELIQTEDFREGTEAFLAKRPAKFKGE